MNNVDKTTDTYKKFRKEFVKLSELEKVARGIYFDIRERSFDGDWSCVEREFARAMLSDWAHERTLSDWTNLAMAFSRLNITERLAGKAMRRLIRANYVYSRAGSKGKRYYGLNLDYEDKSNV